MAIRKTRKSASKPAGFTGKGARGRGLGFHGKPPKGARKRPATGMGTHGIGLGYHGKPGNATGVAKGGGYHGKPPAGVKKGKVVKSPGGKPPVYRKKRVGKLPTRTVKAPRGVRRGR